ncbi:Integrase [Theobroma cacao]|nr:Integrase [Theobroma cacao]
MMKKLLWSRRWMDQIDEALFVLKIANDQRNKDVWLTCSACFNHITGEEGIFTLVDKSFRSEAEIGNRDHIKIMGKGTVSVQTPSENELGFSMKILRYDNGLEYCSSEFKDFLAYKGIKHQLTVLHGPQQNRANERMNKTLVKMARCLLIGKGVPTRFWAEALNTAVNLLNYLPTKALESKSAFKA